MGRSFTSDLEMILGAVTRSFTSEGNIAAVALLALSQASIEQTDYDNWDGGTYGYTLTFEGVRTLPCCDHAAFFVAGQAR
jgi:hypothetical protein